MSKPVPRDDWGWLQQVTVAASTSPKPVEIQTAKCPELIGTLPASEFWLIFAAGASAALILKYSVDWLHTLLAKHFKSWNRRER